MKIFISWVKSGLQLLEIAVKIRLLCCTDYILLWRSEGDIRYDDTCPSTVFYWVQKKMSRAHVPKILINDQALHLSFAVVPLVFDKI